ncbi:MAG: class I SAM-dependent methyltransferase [Oligoflexales bacterium]|nr:class I SAM-dependent methyltransferase [Oligoflexales bacterium]
MSESARYWDEIYTKTPFRDCKIPNEFLVQMLPRMQKGKVLDVAMGEGTNAVYLAQKGFQVKGFDISHIAVEHASQLSRDSGVNIEVKCTDLDLYLMGLMEYDSIIMTYFRPAFTRYYSEIIRALKQGGTLLVESYGLHEMKEPIGKDENYKNFYFSPNELLKGLSGLRILYYQEGSVGGRDVVQCLAQKPVDKHAAMFDMFDMKSGGKEAEKSKQLELAEKLFKK